MERRPIVIKACRRKRHFQRLHQNSGTSAAFCYRPRYEIAIVPPPPVKRMTSRPAACANQSGKRFEAPLSVNGRRAAGLIQSANPPGKIGPVRARDLQRFIGDVEGEDFFFSPQSVHGSDPFRFVTSMRFRIALFHKQLTCSLTVNYQRPIRKQTDAAQKACCH